MFNKNIQSKLNYFSKPFHFISFLSIFLLICFYYNIHQTIFYPPTSLHNWRQADVASITLNYYQNQNEFSNQEVHINGMGDERKLTECPILYYFIGKLYHIFGPNDWVFRGTSLLIVFFGLYSLSLLIFLLIKDLFISFWLPLLLFASPTTVYFSPNFLPNMPAFGLMLIGLYFMFKYFQTHQLKFHYLSMPFFLLAGLIKITSMVAIIAIFGMYLFELLNLKSFRSERKLFNSKWKPMPGFLLMFSGVFYWALGTKDKGPLEAIWELDRDYINRVFSWIYEITIPNLYPKWTIILFLILFVFVIFNPKRIGAKVYLFNWVLLLGVISIFLLIFRPLFIHGYYFIEYLILPISIFITSIYFFKNAYPAILKNNIFRVAMTLFLIYNITFTKKEIDHRYDVSGMHYADYNSDFLKPKEVRAFLKSHGIEYPEAVISAPDWSPNLTLYLMNLKGWSEFSSPRTPLQFPMIYNLAQSETKYLIIHDKKYLEQKDLQPALNNPIANYKNSIFIFDIEYLKEGTENVEK